jgi:hypothetical protein
MSLSRLVASALKQVYGLLEFLEVGSHSGEELKTCWPLDSKKSCSLSDLHAGHTAAFYKESSSNLTGCLNQSFEYSLDYLP